jgi:cytochrome b561
MDAQAERWLHFVHAGTWERVLSALYGCIAIVAVLIGVLGLLGASGLRQMLESWINIHALFGLLLCGLVLARCRWGVKHSPPMSPTDIRQLSRHLSRILYLLLYMVIGLRELIAILNSVWHGGVVDFSLFDQRFRGPDYAGFNPKDDFQLFLASGFITLIFLRALTFTLWLRSVERAALSQVATEDSVSCAPEQFREHGGRQTNSAWDDAHRLSRRDAGRAPRGR